MIVATPAANQPWRPDEQPATTTTLPGLTVIVVVPGLYNGPNHKSLGHCAAGQRIVVPPGPYAKHLLAHGLVELPGDAAEPEPAQTLAPAQPEEPENPRHRGTARRQTRRHKEQE